MTRFTEEMLHDDSAFPGGFNPAIDRYDRRSAARLFRWLWPDPAISRACAANLAASIQIAHEAGQASWEVTMHPDNVRLNVGQVETLTLFADFCRVLFQAPIELGAKPRFEIELTNRPVYSSVPVPSGVCIVPSGELRSLPFAVRAAHNAYIQAAVSYKRGSPHRRYFSPAIVDYLEAALGESLPRPSYFSQEALQCVEPLADEIDDSGPIYEGAKYQVIVNVYERDPEARRKCITEYGANCFVCGFSFGATYGKVVDGFIHVHHLRPLSEIGEEYEVIPVEDLRPVCPNCHAVLHRRVPAYSIAEVQAFLSAVGPDGRKE
jgi:hypothetical protein